MFARLFGSLLATAALGWKLRKNLQDRDAGQQPLTPSEDTAMAAVLILPHVAIFAIIIQIHTSAMAIDSRTWATSAITHVLCRCAAPVVWICDALICRFMSLISLHFSCSCFGEKLRQVWILTPLGPSLAAGCSSRSGW